MARYLSNSRLDMLHHSKLANMLFDPNWIYPPVLSRGGKVEIAYLHTAFFTHLRGREVLSEVSNCTLHGIFGAAVFIPRQRRRCVSQLRTQPWKENLAPPEGMHVLLWRPAPFYTIVSNMSMGESVQSSFVKLHTQSPGIGLGCNLVSRC